MWRVFLFFVFLIISQNLVFSQNLMNSRIRKLLPTKKSIYLKEGIFHNGNVLSKSELLAIRHSYSPNKGYERLVFDFKTKKIPKLYGNINTKDSKLHIDFFKTKLSNNIDSFGSSEFVKTIGFFTITDDILSLELSLKKDAVIDVFYLNSPGRLVVDIK